MPDITLNSAALVSATPGSLKETLLDNKSTGISRDVPETQASQKIEEVVETGEIDAAEETEQPSDELTQEAVERLQTYADQLDRDLEFSVDDLSGRTVVTVRDGSTEEVIRQFPSEEALRLASDIDSGDVSLFEASA